MVSEIYDPSAWGEVPGFDFTDITYHRANDVGAVRVAFNRPDVRNAFRPHTVDELYMALDHARQTTDVGCVLLTGNGPSSTDGGWGVCSGGDRRCRGTAVRSGRSRCRWGGLGRKRWEQPNRGGHQWRDRLH